MKISKKILTALLGFSLMAGTLTSCKNDQNNNGEKEALEKWQPTSKNIDVTSGTLRVDKVENLSDTFIFGMDASCVPSLEAGGVKYYDHEGNEKDVYTILSENGINYVRVRIWNDPFDAEGNGYGGGNCDIENAIEIGKRATANGMKLLVNFHYSDFWADPSKQMIPKAWVGMDIDTKSEALYEYTKECLKKLVDAGVDIGMVQVGNETNGVLCGESSDEVGGWKRITQLFSAGSKAVREVCPDALVVIHVSNPEKVGSYEVYGKNLDYYGVDYDVFASSYYPFWHGTYENLAKVLTHIADTYGKKIMLAETSYAFTTEDSDFWGNTFGNVGEAAAYPFTVQGQSDYIRDLVNVAVNDIPNCLGVFYWEGTWIASGGKTLEENQKLWEKYGSGWATSFACGYDPVDAGQYYGGCTVDNQAMFDSRGRALESLKVFGLMKKGNIIKN